MNNYQFKLVKIQGEFVWHRHADTDEVFYPAVHHASSGQALAPPQPAFCKKHKSWEIGLWGIADDLRRRLTRLGTCADQPPAI